MHQRDVLSYFPLYLTIIGHIYVPIVMVKLLRNTKSAILYSLRSTKTVGEMNTRLWRTTFWNTWNAVPFDEKLIWIAFVGQTIAILTLIELFLLKR